MTTSNNNSRVHQERKVDFICIKMVYRLSILEKYSMYCCAFSSLCNAGEKC